MNLRMAAMHGWRNIAISLIDRVLSANAWLRQQSIFSSEQLVVGVD